MNDRDRERLPDIVRIAVLEALTTDLKTRVNLVEARVWGILTLSFGTFAAVITDIVLRVKGG